MGSRLGHLIDAQRGRLFLWSPVFAGIGVGAYFALPAEPSGGQWAALAAALICGAAAHLRWRWPLLAGLLLLLAGFGLAGLRSAQVAGPVLEWRYYGAVEGRIVEIDRSASDKPRLTLDRVVLERLAPDRTPRRVRLSLHGEQRWLDPRPGQVIVVTAHLDAPEGPVEPGGFDFQRMAWFDRLGAVGYARKPALLLDPGGGGLWVGRVRTALSAHVRDLLPGETGAFAVAITTGDRSGIDAATMADLRASNLAHLLAISGLHMGLLTGLVFAATRIALAAWPGSVAWPVKSIAAIAALIAGAGYLALSGGNVATQRAFVMAAVMLVAVLAGRRALTLRSVAIAALIVLGLRPEALTQPGFQMSFAATTALVVAFRLIRDRGGGPKNGVLRWAMALLVSSSVAGAATAPVAAAHFNQLAPYGLMANLISVPVMGALVMPAALLAACLAPLGLSWIGLRFMAPGIDWILGVAHFVAGLDGSVVPVASPPGAVLPLIALGALWAILWRGRAAVLGAAPACLAAALWWGAERPPVLVAPSAALVGVLGPEGRALSKPRGAGFAARVWLENDGDRAPQAAAAERPGWALETGRAVTRIGGAEIWHLFGRGVTERSAAACVAGRIVVSSQPFAAPGPCLMIDPETLKRSGALALRPEGEGVRLVSARALSGRRPWNAGEGPPPEPGLFRPGRVVATAR